MKTQTETLPPVIIDRSPELRRGNHIPSNSGQHQMRFEGPSGENCVPGDGASCVIAQIFKDIFPGCEPHIEGEHPYIILDGERREVILDTVLIDAIGRFDRGDPDAFKNINVTFTWD